ncbi:bsl1596 [Bradyrhizobium diazoefficiens USDA 110]|uniref:Bsl1596 protein n=1 Tax=Bradyrhizobium diazoefficiens (strain JCM 10833 / BCRC 13528 / IAM 13628 / NBRC 14792 / USDA 110) TaxID=224911 RepID=Q89U23_BRADU|nr:bsl1596 [Bradyrhizobium diazoefficiens USDA 110]
MHFSFARGFAHCNPPDGAGPTWLILDVFVVHSSVGWCSDGEADQETYEPQKFNAHFPVPKDIPIDPHRICA